MSVAHFVPPFEDKFPPSRALTVELGSVVPVLQLPCGSRQTRAGSALCRVGSFEGVHVPPAAAATTSVNPADPPIDDEAANTSLSEALVNAQNISSDAQDRLNRWLAQEQNAVENCPEVIAKLFSRTRHNRCNEAIELIDTTGIDLDVRDENGNSPLMIAAQNGHKKMAKLLMRR